MASTAHKSPKSHEGAASEEPTSRIRPATSNKLVVQLSTPAELRCRCIATDALTRVCEMANHDDNFINEVVSAVTEAFNNTVKHSYCGVDNGVVAFTFRADAAGVEVEIYDNGIGLEQEEAGRNKKEPTEPLESGMGLFIMSSFMDDVEFRCGTPNYLYMQKKR